MSPKFQTDNAKYTSKEGRNNFNPSFNATVAAKGIEEYDQFRSNLDKYIEFLSWARWYPDLFLDLIKSKTGGIKLHSDQRTFMRVAMRFLSMHGVFPRGWGKTFNEVIVMFISCVLYPGVEFSLTAQTKENAAELLKDKYNDIVKKYPWFHNEIYDKKFSKNDGEIRFLNDSRIDVLANSQSSKGQRRNVIMIEESSLLDDFTFQDCLFPIVEHGRMTVGKLGINNPEELSQKVCFYTTAGFRGSSEFARSIRMKDEMVELSGKMVLGSDWKLGCWYGRGSTKQQILDKQKNMSPVAFAQNFQSRWVGSVDGALVDINKIINLRIMDVPKINNDNHGEYFLGVDVARSQDTSNNQSSVAVIEVKRSKSKKIIDLSLVNIVTISNVLNFTAQAIEVKKIFKNFNAKLAVVDGNGLGSGLIDALMKESFDPLTGETLGCWDTINTDAEPEIEKAERCLYDLKSQSAITEITVNFIDVVESGKLKLLQRKIDSDYDVHDKKHYVEKILPFIQTDFLIEEVANLMLKHLSNGKLTIEPVVKKYSKDRYSALSYVLWYIKTFEDYIPVDEEDDLSILTKYTIV